MEAILYIGLDVIILVALVAIFWFMILPRFRTPEQMQPLNDRLAAVGAGWFKRINERLKSWRTIILAYLGTLWLILPDLIQQLTGVEWTRIVDAATASKIAACLYIAALITKLQSTFGRVGDAPAALPANTPGTAVTADEVISKMPTEAAKTFMAKQATEAVVASVIKTANGEIGKT